MASKKDRVSKILKGYPCMAATPACPRPSLVFKIFSLREIKIYRSRVGRNSIVYK